MDNRNRFIKLLTISVDKQDLFLYGFSVPTGQAPPYLEEKAGQAEAGRQFCHPASGGGGGL